jgi:hypothetical protein
MQIYIAPGQRRLLGYLSAACLVAGPDHRLLRYAAPA